MCAYIMNGVKSNDKVNAYFIGFKQNETLDFVKSHVFYVRIFFGFLKLKMQPSFSSTYQL